LQAREQHIRREKATSNICSNQGVMTLYAAMYLSVMGAEGLREVNELSYAGAHYLADELVKTGLVELQYPERPFLNEFVVKCTKVSADDILLAAEAQGILAGVKVADDQLMLAVTEMRSREEINTLVSIVSLLGSDE
jgi:glycine dehydrogenase subunit 1